MKVSAHVDVVMADGTPGDTRLAAGEDQAPEQLDVSPDPHARIILLAPTKEQGEDEARALGISPIAIITPRTIDTVRGLTADRIVESRGLTAEHRAAMMPDVLPAIATSKDA
jgi:hypothetical protein